MDTLSFRTEIQLFKNNISLTHCHKIAIVGSCFAQNIGEKLYNNKFNIILNPFGILFNPASIAQSLEFLVSKNEFSDKDLNYKQDEWFSFNHHSDYSSPNKIDCLHKINTDFLFAKNFINTADFLIITLGSSIAYRLKSSNCIIANCHKFPSDCFEKIHLTSQESTKLLNHAISTLRKNNPSLKIIFTLSPVRYIKDNFMENSLSKANLRIAINQLENEISDCYYFPTFEIMIDDLRDYRFYNQDLIHPSTLAVDYIWHKFSQTFFNNETLDLNLAISDINTAFNHRLKNPNSEASINFKKNILTKIIALTLKHPYLDFEKEKKYFSK